MLATKARYRLDPLDHRILRTLRALCGPDGERPTVREIASAAKTSSGTAQRRLDRLVMIGKLHKTGVGRWRCYYIEDESYGHDNPV